MRLHSIGPDSVSLANDLEMAQIMGSLGGWREKSCYPILPSNATKPGACPVMAHLLRPATKL
jgi:hypothetical protein